ncbi:hypothetical protein HA402_013260 [Bradysia odoriphaga]|nr:hypothetical protein HA402_013260 [Bradysia odoriphaga]
MEGKYGVREQVTEVASSSAQIKRLSESQVKENKQKQLDELEAIQSIFDESCLTIDLVNRCGRFTAYPNISESPYYVTFSKGEKSKLPETNEVAVEASNIVQKMEIKYLPSIEFTFTLDDFYPSEDPPAFLMSCQWLSSADMSRICEHIDTLYSECRSEVLYSCFTFLQDDVLTFLNADKELDVTLLLYSTPSVESSINQATSYVPDKCRGDGKFDKRVVLNESMPNILRILREFDEYKRDELFANEWYCCNICFSRKQGRDCVRFNCNHTNCIDCVREYLKLQIVEGSVGSLKCPEHKCNAMVSPQMVKKIVGDELFRRYDELLLASALNTMIDIVYCPRKSCQSPVVPEADNLAVCPACNFAFCKFCNYTYHGYEPCRLFKNDEERKELLNKYNNGTDSEKEALEKRYGKDKLRRELDTLLSQAWIENYSKACPRCNAKIEKIDGCNKMFCNRCQSCFCWICLEILSGADPYAHFRRVTSKCFNKLFAGMIPDDNLNYNVDEVEDEDETDDDGLDEIRFYPPRFN